MQLQSAVVLCLAWARLGWSAATPTSSPSLPVVDLGYERHRAIAFNSTIGYYNFTNIRFAAPPVGNLRFAAPQAPASNRDQVQNGSVRRICPQADPAWENVTPTFVLSYLLNQTFNASAVNIPTSGPVPAQDPRTDEDCLFLDVQVPRKIFDAAQTSGQGGRRPGYGGYGNQGQANLAPVLVWFFGGGYVGGDKAALSGPNTPAGLLERSEDGIVYVAINYRLGALGWSSGPTFQESGTANAGLHDQRFALEWIQENIHLFGGDKDKVTIFGESAGGGSVMHQITAYGGLNGPVPFRGAIPQSPGWLPLTSAQEQEHNWNNFLALLNVTTIEQARRLPSSAVIAANALQVTYQSGYGNFTYGPTVDGSFVPALPGQLLLHGQFDHSVSIFTGHNADEGLIFTPYYVRNGTQFRDELGRIFPGIQPNVLDYILNNLYPPVYNGTYGYRDPIGRAALLVSEAIFTCNTNYLQRAFNNDSYAYRFDIWPALHGEDVAYTFYGDTALAGNPALGVTNATVAHVLQELITSFAIDLAPTSKTWGSFVPRYDAEANIVNLNASSIVVQRDDTANRRCYWWQKALYY